MFVYKLVFYFSGLLLLFPFLSLSTPLPKPPSCFQSSLEQEKAHVKLQGQVVCANSQSLSDCRDTFFSKGDDDKNIKVGFCSTAAESKISVSSYTVLKAGAFGLAKLSQYKNLTKRKYVNSVVDFHHHTKMHKKRVLALAVELRRKFPANFKDMNEDLLKRLMSRHDNAKMSAKYTYKGKPFYEVLYKYYGKKPPQQVIDFLNDGDKKIMEEAFKREGYGLKASDTPHEKWLKLKIRAQFLKAERMSDLADRINNPVSPEEFGRKKMYPPRVRDLTGKKAEMYAYLEKNYKRFTGDLTYKPLAPKEYYALSQKIMVSRKFKTLQSLGLTFKEMGARSFTALGQVIESRLGGGGVKFAGKYLLHASLVADFIYLMTYSPALGCSATPGHHDWKNEDGCKPIMGLTEKFIEFLSLPLEEREKALKYEDHMCEVVKGNLKIADEEIFTSISCNSSGAKMELAPGKALDISFNSQGSISKIGLDNLNSFYKGFTAQNARYLNYNSQGELQEICFPGRSSRVRGFCKKANLSGFFNTNHITQFISSMNYKIQQGIACCLGIKNEFNNKISCHF